MRTAEEQALIEEFAEDLELIESVCGGYQNRAEALFDMGYSGAKKGVWVRYYFRDSSGSDVWNRYHRLSVTRKPGHHTAYWTCSLCECWGSPAFRYCPSCGAKMK